MTPATSPFGLVQESLEPGPLYPWRVCCASIVLSKSHTRVARPTLDAVLARWPTPTDLASADDVELASLLRPTGLHRTRAKRLRKLAAVWLDVEPTSPDGLPGIGEYGRDCWRLFVEDDPGDTPPRDGRLAAFWAWRTGRADVPPPPERADGRNDHRDVAITALTLGVEAVAQLRPAPSKFSLKRAAVELRARMRGDVADALIARWIPHGDTNRLRPPTVGESRVYVVRRGKRERPCVLVPVDYLEPSASAVVVAHFGRRRVTLEIVEAMPCQP